MSTSPTTFSQFSAAWLGWLGRKEGRKGEEGLMASQTHRHTDTQRLLTMKLKANEKLASGTSTAYNV